MYPTIIFNEASSDDHCTDDENKWKSTFRIQQKLYVLFEHPSHIYPYSDQMQPLITDCSLSSAL